MSRGCAREASPRSQKTRFNPDSSIPNVHPTAKSCNQVMFCGGKLVPQPQNQDSENVYLDSPLSVTDWGRMEVHIFWQLERMVLLWREARASAPKPGSRQCVLGLVVHMPGDSLRGCQGVVREKHRLGPQKPDSIPIHEFPMCTPQPSLATR